MDFQDILTLVKAGYTKEEISAMTADNTAAPPATAAPAQTPAPAETGQQTAPAATQQTDATAAAQQTAPAESTPDLVGVLGKINDTLAALQAAAITGDSRGAATPKPTAGQSLAKAITMTK